MEMRRPKGRYKVASLQYLLKPIVLKSSEGSPFNVLHKYIVTGATPQHELKQAFWVVDHGKIGTFLGGTPTIFPCYGTPKNPRLFPEVLGQKTEFSSAPSHQIETHFA